MGDAANVLDLCKTVTGYEEDRDGPYLLKGKECENVFVPVGDLKEDEIAGSDAEAHETHGQPVRALPHLRKGKTVRVVDETNLVGIEIGGLVEEISPGEA
jgi:hypothetical protein